MSGTSRDGVDVALTRIQRDTIETIDAFTLDYPNELRSLLEKLCQPEESCLLKEIAQAECTLGNFFSLAALKIIEKHKNLRSEIKAIGSHGHTLYHLPSKPYPFSLQVGGAAIINARTGIKTISDFRNADIAKGGEGAPLVPAFHDWALSKPETERVIVNIGGISNITVLKLDKKIRYKLLIRFSLI